MQSSTPAPWHLYIVAILGMLWNSFGAYDWYMTQRSDADYMQQFSAAQLEFFYGLPLWVVACWAIAVWGGVLGCGLLLFKFVQAYALLLVSLCGLLATTIFNYGFNNGFAVIGDPTSLSVTAIIVIVALALLVYTRRQVVNGVLT